jgi:hypothetical protein
VRTGPGPSAISCFVVTGRGLESVLHQRFPDSYERSLNFRRKAAKVMGFGVDAAERRPGLWNPLAISCSERPFCLLLP